MSEQASNKQKIDLIRIDGGTQPRAQLNEEAVTDYANALSEGAKLPPVTLFFDGVDYWLADGFHRYHAHLQIGALEIVSEVRKGTRRDAVLHSVGANASHGLRRTNEDKRRAVETLLDDKEWSTWSDRKIAETCGVSAPFVSAVRRPEVAQKQNRNRAANAAKKSQGCSPTTPNECNPITQDEDIKKAQTEKQKEESSCSEQTQQPAPPSEADTLRAQLADLQERYDELLSQYEEVVAENKSMSEVLDANDQLVAALAEAKKYRELNRIAEERIRGLMNEKNTAIQMVKSLQRKLKAAGVA